ncbi:MAG: GSCFA domain-containing protein [Brumimicrobium sp.]|nr:GSCFA domain-containing protein [Brumimicrobium sp.]
MKKTPVHINPSPCIDYQSDYLFLGSCFSENISQKMEEEGFQMFSNPFGVLFNPVSLAHLFTKSDNELDKSVFERSGVCLSWFANSTCFGYERDVFVQRLIQLREEFLERLKTSKILCITFGTSWVYEKKDIQEVVGNCHKINQNEFNRKMLSIDEMLILWKNILEQKIYSINKNIEIIFTVSPVRHVKDGLIENTRSKGRLIELISKLKEQLPQIHYFPAYEIMLDELRDYAYYDRDGLHPNELAVDIIWDRFKENYFTEDTKKINQDYLRIKGLFTHRLQHPESKESINFIEQRNQKWKDFQEKHLTIKPSW